MKTQQNEEELKMNVKAHPTSLHHATPFGEIEEVFVDTLKEDEEYTRRLQTVVDSFSFEFVVLEAVEVEPVEVGTSNVVYSFWGSIFASALFKVCLFSCLFRFFRSIPVEVPKCAQVPVEIESRRGPSKGKGKIG